MIELDTYMIVKQKKQGKSARFLYRLTYFASYITCMHNRYHLNFKYMIFANHDATRINNNYNYYQFHFNYVASKYIRTQKICKQKKH